MLDDATIIAYLEGELDARAAAAVDDHLLDCDDCWAAVKEDREGRQLAEGMRETASPRLRDRLRMAVEAADGRRAARRRRRVLPLGGAIVVVATGLLLSRPATEPRRDPEAIDAVVRLARAQSPAAMTVTRYRVRDIQVVVARSDRPFAMPGGARPTGPGADAPWVASRGEVTLLCFSRPRPALLVSTASPRALTDAARSLGLA